MRHPCCRNFRCYEFKPCTKYTCLSMKKSLRRSHCNVAIPRLPSSFRKWSKLPPASTFLPSFAFLSSSLGTAIIRNTAQGRSAVFHPSVRPSAEEKPQKPFSAMSPSSNDRRLTHYRSRFLIVQRCASPTNQELRFI